MEYSIELLRIKRDECQLLFNEALKQEPKDWDTICTYELILEDLNKAIDLLCMV